MLGSDNNGMKHVDKRERERERERADTTAALIKKRNNCEQNLLMLINEDR